MNFFKELDFKPCFVTHLFLSAIVIFNMWLLFACIHVMDFLFSATFIVAAYVLLKPLFGIMLTKHSSWTLSHLRIFFLTDVAFCSILSMEFIIFLPILDEPTLSDFLSLMISGALTSGFVTLYMAVYFFIGTKYKLISKSLVKEGLIVYLSTLLLTTSIYYGFLYTFDRFYKAHYVYLIICLSLAGIKAFILAIPAIRKKLRYRLTLPLLLIDCTVCGAILVPVLFFLHEFSIFLIFLNICLPSLSGTAIAFAISKHNRNKA